MSQINANFSAGAVSASSCHTDPSNPTNASTSMQGGQAVFENDNYRITADDNNTVTINNKNTGECYQAAGDPHMSVDGKQDFDFWGKTTFSLEDGTKVTIDTTPAQGNPGATLSSKVTITNGDYGVQISGVDSNTHGDLKIDEAKGYGQVLDAVVTDGNTVQENPAGKGFVAVDDQGKIRKVDQDYINKTDQVKSGKLQDKHQEAFEKLSSLMQIAFKGVFLGNHCGGSEGGQNHGGQHNNGHHSHGGHHDNGHRPHHGHHDNGHRDRDREPTVHIMPYFPRTDGGPTWQKQPDAQQQPRNTFPQPGAHFNASVELFSARIELTMGRMQ